MWRELLFVLLLAAAAVLAVPQGNCGIVKPEQEREVDQNGNKCNGNGKIVGGCEAARHAWPWMTSLRRSSIFGQWHTCGAELISPKWVLTAAHCVQGDTDPTAYRIHFGRHHIDDYSEGTLQLRQLTRVIMHPQFNQGISKSNDVALLELQSQVDINEYVSPVCLPKVDVSGDEPAKITGWGKTMGTCCEDWLKQAPVPILSQATCRRPDILGSAIGDTMVCAGPLAGGIDTCQGDSGGPLVYKYKNPNGKQVWQLNGITSWGYSCAQPNQPGVYSRVFTFLNWIKQVTDLEPPE